MGDVFLLSSATALDDESMRSSGGGSVFWLRHVVNASSSPGMATNESSPGEEAAPKDAMNLHSP